MSFRGRVNRERRTCLCFQAEDGIRDAQESRGLGDVYKRQVVAVGTLAHRSYRQAKALIGGFPGEIIMSDIVWKREIFPS